MTVLLPALDKPREITLPPQEEDVLDNGLRVVVVQRSAVPLVEIRLVIPFAGNIADLPASSLLAQTMLSGTSRYSNVELAVELQRIGGELGVSVDPDHLVISGNAIVSFFPRLLELVAEVLTDAQYPAAEVAIEREHLADQLQIALAQASTVARAALLRRIYGSHPYAVEVAQPGDVRGVDPAQLRVAHAAKVLPQGSTLVIVGDVEPSAGVAAVHQAFPVWSAPGQATVPPPVPPMEPGPLVLANRSGSVQSSLRLALPAVPRSHPDFPALNMANLIFGGYFSSRLVTNLREDKAYTYGAQSSLEHNVAGSMITVETDVASEVTAPALHEIWSELERIATGPVRQDELDDVRQYAMGAVTLSVANQIGLAALLAALAGVGVGPEWLVEYPQRLAKVTVDDVAEVSARYLSPGRAITVVLGDADAVRPSLVAMSEVVDG